MDSLQNPILELNDKHACRFGCTLTRCVGMKHSELHAAGLLYLYTHTSFVTSLSGSEVFCYSKATSAHALSIHCDRGKKKKRSPHSSHTNSNTHHLPTQSIFSSSNIAVSLASYGIGSKRQNKSFNNVSKSKEKLTIGLVSLSTDAT